jgi:hypothetical protein
MGIEGGLMRTLLLLSAVAVAAVIGAAPSVGYAQAQYQSGGTVISPLTLMERNQRNQLNANRSVIGTQLQDRYQNSLELEKQFYDENRRRREDYRFQGNTQQRALEAELREDALRIGQQDQVSRERALKQQQESQQSIEEARRRSGLQ